MINYLNIICFTQIQTRIVSILVYAMLTYTYLVIIVLNVNYGSLLEIINTENLIDTLVTSHFQMLTRIAYCFCFLEINQCISIGSCFSASIPYLY